MNAPYDENDPSWDEYPSENNDFNAYEETIEEYEQRKYDEYQNDDESDD